LIGVLKPDSGKIIIDDKDITSLSEKELLPLRKNIGYLFQEGALYDFMNVFDNVAFPLREHTKFSEDEVRERVREVLASLSLVGVEEKFPVELSGGMKKRVGLARAIVLSSSILLCDEPTSGLDPIRSRDISGLIHDVAKKMHCTTVITSHDIHNSMRIADRLALLHKGRVAAIGNQEELKACTDPFVRDFINP
jgi:phospholipid/cholesterol/gamma-HCH transport system ATP-binding protein